jgi:HSP20 family protein
MTLGLPFSILDLERSRMRRELERLLGEAPGQAAGVFPPVNIYDDGESFLIRAEMPGADREALEITARGDQLTIRGERVLSPAEAPASYHRREREGGQFRRVVTLPQRVDANAVNASYANGILEVRLPRVAEAQPRRVQIT